MRVEGFMTMEEINYGKENMTEYARPSSRSESETTFSYTDESVIDCDLPEMVIFLQKSNYQVVKDIGIDKEVPTQHKCLIKEFKLNRGSELTTEAQNTVASISNESKSSSDHDSNEDVSVVQCCSKHSMEEGDRYVDERDNMSIDGSTLKTMNKKLLLIKEVDNNYSDFQLTTNNRRRSEQKSDQFPSTVTLSTNSMVSALSRVTCNNFNTSDSSFNSQKLNESIFHELDSSKPTRSIRLEGQRNENLESPHENEIMPRLEDGMTLESFTNSSLSSRVQHCRVESSSSIVGSLSGPLSCSGPISYSGSTSLRSNSSTTSTQSFAFPVLPTEWNGSPARMVKADRRQFRKHQRWRCLLCCEF